MGYEMKSCCILETNNLQYTEFTNVHNTTQLDWNPFIVLLNARLFHLNLIIFDLRENMYLSQAWILLFLTTITNGNNMHDKVTSGRPINFTAADAFPHLESALEKCEIDDS